jgi:hypothetical protein
VIVLAAHAALFRAPRLSAAILAGASLGIVLLVRHHFSLLFALGILGSGLAVAALRWRNRWRLCLGYAGAALVVFVPWGVRNCLVVGALSPLGTQGGHSLGASFAYDEVTPDGSWDAERLALVWERRKGLPPDYDAARLAIDIRGSLEMERELAVAGQETARRWLRRNWRQIPKAVLIRLRAHALGYGPFGLAALAFGLAAFAFPEMRREAAVCLALLAMSATTVVMTFEAGRGRYSAPVRPAAYLMGALGLAGAGARLLRRGGPTGSRSASA